MYCQLSLFLGDTGEDQLLSGS